MVREEESVLVPPLAETFEPRGDARVEPSPPGLGQACVRDLARQRVLEGELVLTRDRRAGLPTDEVALLKASEGQFDVL